MYMNNIRLECIDHSNIILNRVRAHATSTPTSNNRNLEILNLADLLLQICAIDNRRYNAELNILILGQ